MCISAGIDGANAIRWEEGSLRTTGASEIPDEEKTRPDTFKFSEDGPSLVSYSLTMPTPYVLLMFNPRISPG